MVSDAGSKPTILSYKVPVWKHQTILQFTDFQDQSSYKLDGFCSRIQLSTYSMVVIRKDQTTLQRKGLVRIQYKCLVPIYVYPEIKITRPHYFQNRIIMFCLPISESDLYIRSVFCCSQIGRPNFRYSAYSSSIQ
jgi:hypothetical protein